MGNTTNKKLTAAIYDPYLDSLGGGERYCLTIAEILLQHHWNVDLFWSGDPSLISQAEKFFQLKLTNLNPVPNIFASRPQSLGPCQNCKDIHRLLQSNHHKAQHLLSRFQALHHYDLLIFLSDGSVPLLFSRKNILHIQVPLRLQLNHFQRFQNYLKLLLIPQVIFNSKFTTQHTPYIPPSKASLLYPPVDVDQFSSTTSKENIILSVGRFDEILNIKRQDVLIDAFKQLVDRYHLRQWRLILAGGSIQQPHLNHYLSQLQSQAQGYPIEFLVKPSFSALRQIYSQSKIYWHAAGYQVDEFLHPEMTEHFGITVVEAMASGSVPLVTNKGGLPEIIDHQQNGYLWGNITDLTDTTHQLIQSPSTLKRLSTNAQQKSIIFSKSNFEANLLKIIGVQL